MIHIRIQNRGMTHINTSMIAYYYTDCDGKAVIGINGTELTTYIEVYELEKIMKEDDKR